MIALSGNDYIKNDPRRLISHVYSETQPSLLERLSIYLFRRSAYKKAKKLNGKLHTLLTFLQKQENISEVVYNDTRELLGSIKRFAEEPVAGIFTEKIKSINSDNVATAYKVEKLCRVKYFSSKEMKPTSEQSGKIAFQSMATSARNL